MVQQNIENLDEEYHWKINDWDEYWGKSETFIVKEYAEFLLKTNPEYLQNREQMIEDVSVLIWSVFYQINMGRVATRNEIEHGINYSMPDEKEQQRIIDLYFDGPQSPAKEEHIESSWEEHYSEPLGEYLNYLKKTNPQRLEDHDRILEDMRLLNYDLFYTFRHRPARREELEWILERAEVCTVPRPEPKTFWQAFRGMFNSD